MRLVSFLPRGVTELTHFDRRIDNLSLCHHPQYASCAGPPLLSSSNGGNDTDGVEGHAGEAVGLGAGGVRGLRG